MSFAESCSVIVPSALQHFLKKLDGLLDPAENNRSLAPVMCGPSDDMTNVVRQFTSRGEMFVFLSIFSSKVTRLHGCSVFVAITTRFIRSHPFYLPGKTSLMCSKLSSPNLLSSSRYKPFLSSSLILLIPTLNQPILNASEARCPTYSPTRQWI